jgi:hypothetical protein
VPGGFAERDASRRGIRRANENMARGGDAARTEDMHTLLGEPLDAAGKWLSGMINCDPTRSVTWSAFYPASHFPV